MSDLSAIWTKSNCLSRTQLLQYLQHTLDREEEYLVESHLNDCSLCSDALEGLMHADLTQVPADLDDMRKAFEAAVAAAAEKEKPRAAPPVLKSRRTYWLYAASVLLIVGLGYSVFSFIQGGQGQKKALSQETGAKISNADKPYFAVQDSSPERMHLELRPEDLPAPAEEKTRSDVAKLTESKAMSPGKTIVAAKEAEKPAPPAVVSSKAETAVEADAEPITEDVRAGSAAPAVTEATKALPLAKEGLSSGRPGPGLKKSATPINQSPVSNQLNYSSAPENRNAKEEMQEVSTVSTRNQAPVDEYQDALKLYEKGNYRRSIRKLERLLKDSRGDRREDILYYLAKAWQAQGESEKAETYFAQLKQSARYKAKAAEALREAKKK